MLEGYWVLGGGRPPLPSTQTFGLPLVTEPNHPNNDYCTVP